MINQFERKQIEACIADLKSKILDWRPVSEKPSLGKIILLAEVNGRFDVGCLTKFGWVIDRLVFDQKLFIDNYTHWCYIKGPTL